MANIVIFTDDPGEGGVAIYVHSIACGLARLGYQVTCVQSEADNPMIQERRQLGIGHHWLPFHTRAESWRTLNNFKDAKEAFAAAQPQAVLFANCSPFSHIGAKTTAVRMGMPFVVVENYVVVGDNFAPEFVPLLPHLEEHYFQARAVVAVSQENLSHLRRNYRLAKGKGEVIHYGRPKKFFTPRNLDIRHRLRREFSIPSDAVVCLTIGRLEEVKGYDLILKALGKLAARPIWKKMVFAWLGEGSLDSSLKATIEGQGMADRVKVLGHRWNVDEWLDASDIFLLPSRYEGMPISIMEAMAKGLPVMATAISGTPEELGPTGKLLTSPQVNADATVPEIVQALEQWAGDAELRKSLGAACHARAAAMFREERMVEDTRQVLERALLPKGDYVSPGFAVIRPDTSFPNMVVGDCSLCPWPYLRAEIPHHWYVDKRAPSVGFVNRDEASILYNTALRFKGKRCLEIGCWLGWSACHLALGGVLLDVIDPILAEPSFLQSVRDSLSSAGLLENVKLVAGASPEAVDYLSSQHGRQWSLFFIDGHHGAPAPINDATVCAEHAEADALILFHDLAAPDVAYGLDYLKHRGWQTMVYSTMQIMGVAWRGNVKPVWHRPDPNVSWEIPTFLHRHRVSGVG